MSGLIRRVIGSNGVVLQTLKSSMPLRCLGSTARQSAAGSSSDVPVSTRSDVQKLITVDGHEDLTMLSPSDELKTRQIRIYQPAKNAMQSGTDNLRCWHLDFDTQERWENPLMGWTSSADPMSNMQMEFDTKEDAIMFCQKNGWEFSVDTKVPLKPKVKSYGANYSWNKRTRTSTK